MELYLLKRLHAEGLLSDEALRQAEAAENHRLFSLSRELRTLLYLGVLLLSSGLGVLIYKNIDTIGHQAVLALIALICIGCFTYCLRKMPKFSWGKMASPNAGYDYTLLLGCLSLLSFIGYLQFAYDAFGHRYGLATFIPMVLLFLSAYYFDHLGVLSLAVTNLAAWAGIAITPAHLLDTSNFASDRIIYTGVVLGVVLLATGRLSDIKKLKPHFEMTYTNFGFHLFFIAMLAGLITHYIGFFFWTIAFAGAAVLIYREVVQRRSFYFLVFVLIYSYIAVSYTLMHLLFQVNEDLIALVLLYFVVSAAGVGALMMHHNKKFKSHERLSKERLS